MGSSLARRRERRARRLAPCHCRVPSDVAMVMGDSLVPPAAADNAAMFDSMVRPLRTRSGIYWLPSLHLPTDLACFVPKTSFSLCTFIEVSCPASAARHHLPALGAVVPAYVPCPPIFCPPRTQLPDDCDSSMARAIQASLDEARAAQQRQQAAVATVGGEGGAAATAAAAPGEAVQDSTAAADPNRPSDAAIIAWENEIRQARRTGSSSSLWLEAALSHGRHAQGPQPGWAGMVERREARLHLARRAACGADMRCHLLGCREAEVKRMPLMGDREPLAALAAEYAAGSSIYQQKVGKLGEAYGSIR